MSVGSDAGNEHLIWLGVGCLGMHSIYRSYAPFCDGPRCSGCSLGCAKGCSCLLSQPEVEPRCGFCGPVCRCV